MADISTAVSMARVPILGENGRISDDYIPAAIGENVAKAESAATRAETAATNAEGSASAASQSATQASGSASAASASARQAQQSATTADGAATSAQSAQTAAEAAQSSAAGSARDAQQSATAAAESAASVADKFISSARAETLEPGSQATASVENQVLTIGVPKGEKGDKGDKGDTGTGVPEGGTPGQLLSKTEDGAAWVDPPSGNVLTGTLGPAPVLSADDAYATKPRSLSVFGETRQNLWVNPPTATKNGLTLTANDDGSITVGGTSTASVSTYFNVSHTIYTLKPETTYTLSVDKAFTGMYATVREDDSSGSTITDHNVLSGALTFQTKANMASCLFYVSVVAGSTVSGTYRVMLNEGSTAEPWCPPGLNSVGDDGSVKIVTAGKNLIDASSMTINKAVNTETGEICTTSASGNWYATETKIPCPPPSSSIVCSADSSHSSSIAFYFGDGTFISGKSISKTKAVTVPDGASLMAIDVYKDYFANFQLELGSTATAYEPPTVVTTPIDLDGHTLNSLPDGTCDELTIDATGAVTLTKRVGDVSVASGTALTYVNADNHRFNATIPSGAGTTDYENGYSDKLPVRMNLGASPMGVIHSTAAYMVSFYANGTIYSSSDAAKTAIQSVLPTRLLYPLAAPETISLTPVTLPTLPAPNITVYNDSDVPSDITLEYERDVTIAFDKLQAQVSATTVREATNG